jgi:hypothetical protein
MQRVTLSAKPLVLGQRRLLLQETGPPRLPSDPAVITPELQPEPKQPSHLVLNDRFGNGHGLHLNLRRATPQTRGAFTSVRV